MNNTKISEIKRETHELDANGQILGRLATKVAGLLMGKAKPNYVSHLDCGDFVTIKNAVNIKVTGKKETNKVYTHYSGYPGGLKSKTLKQVRKENPTQILHRAIFGMLPKNKLRDIMITRLKFI
ncbi:MAG: 50S ribosomal protein L13 [bacterium]|nr:50S ribosomal protein L13 [bacterium]